MRQSNQEKRHQNSLFLYVVEKPIGLREVGAGNFLRKFKAAQSLARKNPRESHRQFLTQVAHSRNQILDDMLANLRILKQLSVLKRKVRQDLGAHLGQGYESGCKVSSPTLTPALRTH
jgi:hypothetical protein